MEAIINAFFDEMPDANVAKERVAFGILATVAAQVSVLLTLRILLLLLKPWWIFGVRQATRARCF